VRREFTAVVSEIIANEPSSVLLLGDIGVYGFREVLEGQSDRAFNFGILEQSMVGVAAGMASNGKIPFMHTIAPFIVERAFEQIKIDFGYHQLPGNIVSVGASFDYASLGSTHHCPGDITLLQTIENIQMFVPGNSKELEFQIRNNWNNGKLNYFRLSEIENSFYPEAEISYWTQVRHGTRGSVVVVGPMLDHVIDCPSTSDMNIFYCNRLNLDNASLATLESTRNLVIVEPYYSGPMLKILRPLLENNHVRVLEIGIPFQFSRKYGSRSDHFRDFGLTKDAIDSKIERFLSREHF
jgi:transketolase